MKKEPLYIVWNQKQAINVPIIDEQHHAIVAAINSLYFFITQGWGLSALSPTLKIIKATIGFHLKTEEGILEKLGANHEILHEHSNIFNTFSLNADISIKEAIIEQDPMILLKFLRDWWLQHRNEDHPDYAKTLSTITVTEDEY
jgi:hemerythrin-like metal-binding protein